jgi:hypothetical protein
MVWKHDENVGKNTPSNGVCIQEYTFLRIHNSQVPEIPICIQLKLLTCLGKFQLDSTASFGKQLYTAQHA